jgi:hypothetical protein
MLANLLVVLPGALLLLLAHGRRGGPEGPVGAHMVTLPLAVAVAVGVGLACAAGPLALLGVPAWVGYASLPGLAVGLCVLPILAFEQQHRLSSRLAVVAGVVGGAGLASAPATGAPGVVAAVAGALVLVPSLFGYGLLVVFWWHQQQNAIAAARADVARQSEFERSQAAWQLGEWQKLPPAPALWQLIQFTHAFHPEVQAECRARIQALPDLDAAMAELLGRALARVPARCLPEVARAARAGTGDAARSRVRAVASHARRRATAGELVRQRDEVRAGGGGDHRRRRRPARQHGAVGGDARGSTRPRRPRRPGAGGSARLRRWRRVGWARPMCG